MKLELMNISCGYENKEIIKDINLSVCSGEVLCILGPNGVGKTTLFKAILGFIPLMRGEVIVDDQPLQHLSQKEKAKTIAYVPQAHEPPFPYKVSDVVLMGRTAHMSTFATPTRADRQIAMEALESIGAEFLKDKIYTEISGGERQMVLIARALAQMPKFLVLDEPTSNLDFGNQMRVLEQIIKLSVKGLGIVMTTHSPDHAFLCSTKTVLIARCDQIIDGTAEEVITENNLNDAYGVEVKITSATNSKGEHIQTCVPMLRS